ncbi:MAG: tetratricopeptide repeat protein, partial [Anaerolineae bacterium]|nr:tetratricopeptide repeat protein [Anaerolineae bacterium]
VAPLEPAEIPDWLQERAPVEELPAAPEEAKELPAEDLVPPEVPRAQVPPTEPEIFGWTAFGAEEEVSFPEHHAEPPPESFAAEAAPAVEGFGWTGFDMEPPAAVEEAPPAADTTFGWSGFDHPEPPPPIAGPPVYRPPKETEEAVRVEEPEELEREVAEAPPSLPAAAAPAEPEPPAEPEAPLAREIPRALQEEIERLQGLLQAKPRDKQTLLELAQRLQSVGLYDAALEAYSPLVRSRKWAEAALPSVQSFARECSKDPRVHQLLGDAYMRVGELDEALAVYRVALEHV